MILLKFLCARNDIPVGGAQKPQQRCRATPMTDFKSPPAIIFGPHDGFRFSGALGSPGFSRALFLRAGFGSGCSLPDLHRISRLGRGPTMLRSRLLLPLSPVGVGSRRSQVPQPLMPEAVFRSEHQVGEPLNRLPVLCNCMKDECIGFIEKYIRNQLAPYRLIPFVSFPGRSLLSIESWQHGRREERNFWPFCLLKILGRRSGKMAKQRRAAMNRVVSSENLKEITSRTPRRQQSVTRNPILRRRTVL